ncbi:MAG: peptidoglycan-associated lipoprotein Pal [Geobacteraceae bacterium]|nr:peptidoglycan-associated lipoprotein Pal [Geobacteraceae bacterium]
MSTKLRLLYVALGITTVVASGCANKEAVKADEPIAAQTVKAKSEPVKTAAPQTSAAKATPPNAQVNPAVAAAATSPVSGTSFESVYFAFDKADLNPASRNVLTANAAKILKSSAKIKIEGNCDERGSAEYNLALGERRAKSAMKYLTTLGVPANRLTTISYGNEHPAVAGHDEAAWAKNRRDDFVIQ